MTDEPMQQTAGQKSASGPANAMAMCPMAKMCTSMMEKPHSSALLMLPGVILIALGLIIFIEPRIAVWLVGGFVILMGLMFFMMARFMGRVHKPSF